MPQRPDFLEGENLSGILASCGRHPQRKEAGSVRQPVDLSFGFSVTSLRG